VDLIVFDGLADDQVRRVVLVEVKTGNAGLTSRERLVRDAVRAGRVEWVELRLGSRGVTDASDVVGVARRRAR
jgi:predicted Holliday junction resolvase-like endonuclease